MTLSWRVQRSYGDCRLFASRRVADVIRADRDLVHHTITHSKVNYPSWVDTTQALKFIAVVCSVFIHDGSQAIAAVGLVCLVQLLALCVMPPYKVMVVNYVVLGSLVATLLSLASIFWVAWATKDSETLDPTQEFDHFLYDLTGGFHWLLITAIAIPTPAVALTLATALSYIFKQAIWNR
jgi:hypothetical protein